MIRIKFSGKLNSTIINLPASKSISNRLLIINALSYSPYPVKNLSDCDDTLKLLAALNSGSNKFNAGNAGSTMRFLTAFLSKIVGEWYLTGNEQMNNRPVGILVDSINKLGGRIEYVEKEGFPPLKIFGSALAGGEIEIAGNVSSQFVSALLMIAPVMEKGITIKFKGLITSKPYIDMTLSLMKQFGIEFTWEKNVIHVSPQEYCPVPAKVECDWSAASYWFEIMALSNGEAEIFLNGLNKNSIQGDAIVTELFKQLGVKSIFTPKGLKLEKTDSRVEYFNFDFTDYPDIAQTVSVTCAFLNIPFKLTGLHTLKIKETDRISALTAELRKFGFDIKNNNSDSLWWDGNKIERQTNICLKTCNDHRMAMAFAPAALKTEPFLIENPEVVSKSYPKYWNDLMKAGFEYS